VRPGKKLHAPVGVPPSGLLTSLRLLVQCLPPATTRRTGRGGRRGKKEEGREKEREREKKGKEGRKREGEGKGRKEVGYRAISYTVLYSKLTPPLILASNSH
jgi:hypothetical protein